MIREVEFFLNSHGRSLVVNDLKKQEYKPLDRKDHLDIIEYVYTRIKEDFPLAFERLTEIYRNKANWKFLFVQRFLKCNFSKHDDVSDIDDVGDLRLEIVMCPLKGECPDDGIICSPKFSNALSDRELEVVELLVATFKVEEIADKLFISTSTVCNHRKRIYKKLKINGLPELINYAYKNNLTK